MFRNLKLIVKWVLLHYWISVVIIVVAGMLFIYWILYLLPCSDLNSARYTLSALVQSVAALFGLLIVLITFMWSQATTEEQNLNKIRDKYLMILTNMDVESREVPEQGTIIEQLRKDYFRKIKSKCRSGNEFPFLQTKYKSDKDLFLEICALSTLVDTFVHKGERNNIEEIDADLGQLDWAEREEWLYSRRLRLMREVVTFFDVLYHIFGLTNPVLWELRYGWELPDKLEDHFSKDNVYFGLERILRFRTFKGVFFKINMFAFILTLVVGLLILSSLSDSHFTQNLLLLPMTLGIISISLLTITLNRLLHSD